MAYVVVAPYVTVRTMTEQGPRIIGLYTGAPVPEDAPEEWVKSHAEAGLIAEVEDPAAAVVTPLTPIERMEAGERGESESFVVAARVHEGEVARTRSRAAQKAAETRRQQQEQGEPAKPAEPAPAPVAPPAGPAVVKPAGK